MKLIGKEKHMTKETLKWIIPNPEWAKTFLELQSASDESALQYLADMMENTFTKDDRMTYTAIRYLVESLLCLNVAVVEMETGSIEHDSYIDRQYRDLMGKLIDICKASEITRYVIYHEFENRFVTTERNYNAYIRNASKVLNVSKFPSDEAVQQYLISNWNLDKSQILIR